MCGQQLGIRATSTRKTTRAAFSLALPTRASGAFLCVPPTPPFARPKRQVWPRAASVLTPLAIHRVGAGSPTECSGPRDVPDALERLAVGPVGDGGRRDDIGGLIRLILESLLPDVGGQVRRRIVPIIRELEAIACRNLSLSVANAAANVWQA